MEILVPAYCYPERGKGYWEALARACLSVRMTVVVNPHNGPGQNVDPNYTWAVDLLRGAGARLLGYVHTNYAKRQLAEVTADMYSFQMFYPAVSGFFIDEVPDEGNNDHIAYFTHLREFANSRSPTSEPLMLIGNPGCNASPDYIRAGLFDRMVISESPTSFTSPSYPRWLRQYPSQTFAAIVYSIASKERMTEVVRDCLRAHIGMLYVTDCGGGNPYDRLPSYWGELVAFVREVNSSPDAVKLLAVKKERTRAMCC